MAVISEACILLRKFRGGAGCVLALVESGAVQIGINLSEQLPTVRKLFDRYNSVPTSLADACLVRLSEPHDQCVLLPLDSDFHIYRRHGRKSIPLLQPDCVTGISRRPGLMWVRAADGGASTSQFNASLPG